MYNTSLLVSDAEKLGISLTDEQLYLFEKLSELLVEQNKTMNLTAITDPDGIAVKHFADSISALSACEFAENAKVLDVGTGAGFPSIPLLIARPDLEMTMIDSTAKKLRYVASTVETLGLSARVLHTRAEEAGQNKAYRESFDICTARAVARLNTLCEYCMPFIKVNGSFIALKGNAEEEINEDIENAARRDHNQLEHLHHYNHKIIECIKNEELRQKLNHESSYPQIKF